MASEMDATNNQKPSMDVVKSLRKVSKELEEINWDLSKDEIQEFIEGASWLISYVCDCLDVELAHAVTRGRTKQLGNGNNAS